MKRRVGVLLSVMVTACSRTGLDAPGAPAACEAPSALWYEPDLGCDAEPICENPRCTGYPPSSACSCDGHTIVGTQDCGRTKVPAQPLAVCLARLDAAPSCGRVGESCARVSCCPGARCKVDPLVEDSGVCVSPED